MSIRSMWVGKINPIEFTESEKERARKTENFSWRKMRRSPKICAIVVTRLQECRIYNSYHVFLHSVQREGKKGKTGSISAQKTLLRSQFRNVEKILLAQELRWKI